MAVQLAAYVLVLGLPGGSPIPCGVSVGKGDFFGWARLAQVSTLSSFRPCGTCPPLLQKPSANLIHPCSATMSQVCLSPRAPIAKGAALLIQKMPGYPLQERTRTVGWDHWYGTYDMHVVTVDTWNHELG